MGTPDLSGYMSSDKVTASQFANYTKLMPQLQAVLGSVPRQQLATSCKQFPHNWPGNVRQAVPQVLQHLPNSHIWVKGAVAAYLHHTQP